MVGPLELVRLSPLMARTSGRADVVVGLIDGPVAAGHTAFARSRIKEAWAGQGGRCVRADSIACTHGTFIAGMLVAGRGSAAPAICPGCTLLVRPIFTELPAESARMPGATPQELAAAIRDAIRAGAHVLNLSLGLVSNYGVGELQEALDHAARRGVLVAAAAGNQGTVGSTALTRHHWVIPVVACSLDGRPLPESNLGASLGRGGVCAPGQNITSLGASGEPLTMGGTSVATPFAAGTLALLRSEFPSVAPAEVKRALLAGGHPRRGIVPPLLDAESAYQRLRRNDRR